MSHRGDRTAALARRDDEGQQPKRCRHRYCEEEERGAPARRRRVGRGGCSGSRMSAYFGDRTLSDLVKQAHRLHPSNRRTIHLSFRVTEGMGKVSKSIWYHLGYALETARHGARSAQEARPDQEARPAQVDSPAEKSQTAEETKTVGGPRGRSERPEVGPAFSPIDQLLAAGSGVVGDRLLSILGGRRPGTLRLTHAALAGAGAGLALSFFRKGTNGTSEEARSVPDPTEAMIAGAARGVLYGAVLEPRLPGSPLVRGATYGVMEYVTSPLGGLDNILGASSPHRTMPILAALLGPGDAIVGSMADHIAFGVTLGLLYGAGGARRGSREAE